MRRGTSLLCALFLLAACASQSLAKNKSYAEMSPSEQLAFLERETARATAAIAEDGKPVPVTASGLLLVKREVDDYASRVGSTNPNPFRDDMRTVLDRAAQYAPGVAKTFKSEGVPVTLGLYLAMIESEYQPCLRSPMGAKGVFQILPTTGARFGLSEDDLCDAEKSAVAAARYLHDTRAQFGASGKGAMLAVIAYNQGERAVNDTLASQQDLWVALAKTPNAEGTRYLARILAATIVGENPEAFGVPGRPLSSY